jgi:apolipoprotein N-acyltransferase
MNRYGGMPAPLAAGALVAFAAYLSLWPALACMLTVRLSRAGRTRIIAFAAAQTLAEVGRGYLLTGFPWLAAGYAQMDGPLEGFAPILGVYGMGGAAALLAGALSRILHKALSSRRIDLAAGALALGVMTTGLVAGTLHWGEPSPSTLPIRLVQGNIAQNLKFDPGRTVATMHTYLGFLDGGSAALTVLPETAWTVPWEMTPPAVMRAVRERLGGDHVLAIGMPLRAPDEYSAGSALAAPAGSPRFTNSVAVVDHQLRMLARYDKRHLVPFGEFVPLGFRWFVDLMHIPLGDFARGPPTQAALLIDNTTIAFNICYEDLFGEELAAQVRQGAGILINLSNIAWFGQSHALGQHLGIARIRARELSRPMLRATNTGVSAAIDHRGQVQASLPVHEAGALIAQARPVSGLTPFARYGNTAAVLLSLMALIVVAWTRRRA